MTTSGEEAVTGSRLLERAGFSIAGGAINQLSMPGGTRRVLSRGLGSHVWDVDGREYIDYVLGSGPLIIGHAHPRVVSAVQRQAGMGSTFYTLTSTTIELAERIIDRVRCAERVLFCSTGSEATFYAMRLARAATGRTKILKFEGGFHGGSDYSLMSMFPIRAPDYPKPEASSAGIPPSIEADVLITPFNDAAMATEAVEQHHASIAAVIVEPVQRAIAPIPGFLETLRALCTKYGIVLIFDEVVTGFRIAPGGAQELFGVVPDLATLGKVIGGGYPLAAVAGVESILSLADHRRRGEPNYVYASGTLSGNPLSAAAGLATLEVLDEPGAYRRLSELGLRLRLALQDVFDSAAAPAQILGVGPLFQVFIALDPIVDHRGTQKADRARLDGIATSVLEAGFFLGRDKGYISLQHTDEEIDSTAAAFHAALQAS